MASNFDEQRNTVGGVGLPPNVVQYNPVGSVTSGGLGPVKVQAFTTGATRSADDGKNEYEGFLSFPAIEEFGDYMTRHRVQPDGTVRDSDNWQKGIPIASYVKSLLRHALELWGLHRGHVSRRLRKEYPLQSLEFLKRETACAIFFNVQGFLHETLKLGTPTPAATTGPAVTLTQTTVPLDFAKLKEEMGRQNRANQQRQATDGWPFRDRLPKYGTND